MKDYLIPLDIQSLIQERMDFFCEKEFPECPYRHIAVIRGKFIYIKRLYNDNTLSSVSRLTYEGDLEKMKFAIYQADNAKYNTDFFFPGGELVDGTIEGALRAGMKVYPVGPKQKITLGSLKNFTSFIGSLFKRS